MGPNKGTVGELLPALAGANTTLAGWGRAAIAVSFEWPMSGRSKLRRQSAPVSFVARVQKTPYLG